ncbi:MAG: hypothetical protein FJZ47_12955 [Candidatus Tectomicrobia bacterium]|uniref:Uncharacterized protein n=1 Tax=Tectimicrobiota bacterium TaxID=2528274 RepID=A0A938B1A0_UNCTE|nr:hypothetical protein [Candidatus Tectomicrobia bacterium]
MCIGIWSVPILATPVFSQEPPAVKAPATTPAPRSGATSVPSQVRELLELSQKSKLALTFMISGQSLTGTVTQIHSDEAVEIRNQTHKRFVIRLDRIDAVGIAN